MKLLPLVFIAAPLAACSSSDGPSTRFTIGAAALSLDPIGEATYGLTVRNADGDVVWSKDGLGSLRYGNDSGSLSYVGSCDASSNPHQVELVLVDGTRVGPRAVIIGPQHTESSPQRWVE